jgi:hypothetical protein
MKRSVSIWIVLLAMALASSWILSCRDDVNVPFPPSIVGKYTGIYQFIEIENNVDTVIDTTQLVEFQFRQTEYKMDIEGTIPESLRVFCDVIGEYELGNGVDMGITDSNYTRGVCTQYWSPGGYFSLNQTSDTLRMLNEQIDTAGVRRVRSLRLVNIDD